MSAGRSRILSELQSNPNPLEYLLTTLLPGTCLLTVTRQCTSDLHSSKGNVSTARSSVQSSSWQNPSVRHRFWEALFYLMEFLVVTEGITTTVRWAKRPENGNNIRAETQGSQVQFPKNHLFYTVIPCTRIIESLRLKYQSSFTKMQHCNKASLMDHLISNFRCWN